MAAWGNNFFLKKNVGFFFHFSTLLKCHWPIRAPLATGRVLMKRLLSFDGKSNSHRSFYLIFEFSKRFWKIEENTIYFN